MKVPQHEAQQQAGPKDSEVVNPAASGGAGTDFQSKVGAACLTLLLTRGAPFFLENCAVTAVHFQSGFLGWRTEDLLVEATAGDGVVSKAAVQVKLSFVLSERNDDCVEVFQRAFADFINGKVFNPQRDMIGLITSTLSSRVARGLRTLLDCARASNGPADMAKRLDLPDYLGAPTTKYYQTIATILRNGDPRNATDDAIQQFLNRFDVLDLDLNMEGGFSEAMLRSLLRITATDNDSASDGTWSELYALAAASAKKAASFPYSKLPEHLRKRHSPNKGCSAGVNRLLEDTNIVLDGICTSIGGQANLPRASLVRRVCELIEDNSVVFLSGEAGSGKSALAKLSFSTVALGGLGFAFRAEALAGNHINDVLGKFGLTLEGLRTHTGLHRRKILWIESLERLLERNSEDRTAFLDLLRGLKSDPT